jgi:hypothetical protein
MKVGLRLGSIAATAFVYVALALPAAEAAGGNISLASHRAIYDLKLVKARGNRPIQSVRGRILYDFSGNACEGYALQFRQVSEIDSGEGQPALSDLRAATWEEGESKSFRFNSQNFTNSKPGDSVDGKAERNAKGVKVALAKPSKKAFELAPKLSFPTQHMRQIIEAAQAGKTVFEVTVYDGSESGEKLYETLTVIGRPIEAGASKPADAAGADAALAGMRRWPVRISYFDKAKSEGEATPVYSIAFELYENGISRNLSLDYNDFVVSGEMTTLEIRKQAPCK